MIKKAKICRIFKYINIQGKLYYLIEIQLIIIHNIII